MDEAVVQPHWLFQEREAKVLTIGCQVGMIGRDQRFVEQMTGSQPRCAQDDGIDQVNNVGLELVQAAHKEWAKEVKFEFWIKGERQSSCADYFGTSVVIHATFWAEEQGLVPVHLQVFQQPD